MRLPISVVAAADVLCCDSAVTIDTDREVTDLDALLDKLTVIRREIRDEYLKPHSKPWIIGFSGGKDSTLLAHFVIECILSVPPDERHRAVFVVCDICLS